MAKVEVAVVAFVFCGLPARLLTGESGVTA